MLPWETPQPIIKISPYAVKTVLFLIILFALFGTLIWSSNEMKKTSYKEGVEEGKQTGQQEIVNFIANQLNTEGELRIKVGENDKGEDLVIRLRPMKNDE